MLDAILAKTNVQPRDYQQRLVTKTVDYFNHGIKTTLVNSPTGSGKTIMGFLAAKVMQEQHNIGIGWCAMRRNLLTQAAHENARLGIGVQGVKFISMFDKNPPTHDNDGRPIKLLVVDEAQHDAANSMAHLHNLLKPKWVLGMTATPFRTDRIKLCFEKVIRDIGIHQLIQLGYLSQYHQYTINKWDVGTVVATFLREPERWGKSAIYFHTREEADECCNQLKAAGIKAATVFGDLPMDEREARLEAFDKGDLQVLVNMVILTEGWDCPSLKTVFVRDSVRGPTVQMAGRVFRKYPGMTHKQIVQSKLTRWPIQRTAAPAMAYSWMSECGDWRSYAQSEEIEKVSMRVCITLAHIETKLPDFLMKKLAEHRPRRRRGGEDRPRTDTESGLAPRDDSGFRSEPGWTGGGDGGAIIH